MLNKSYVNNLRSQFLSYALVRRDIIKMSDDALHHSKRAIFALHRDDREEAKMKLDGARDILKKLRATYRKEPKAWDEGAYRASVEEFVEATLFYQFLATGKIGEVKDIPVDGESYLSGLCDVPGELYRYAIKAATKKDIAMVKKCAEAGEEIVGELIEFNLTSYLRNKFDQAKQAVQKLEQIVYETAIRGN